MTYQQVYAPNINTRASPAMCLQYIDDAGNAPRRSTTAKAAFLIEQAAGRIRTTEIPEGVWVVAWFEFTKGSYRYPNGSVVYYKDAWHIAFVRRNRGTVEIHDSEVHSGARQPYAAIAAVEAWFAAYGTRYVGWSTHCDGREYVKEVDMNPEPKFIKDIGSTFWGMPVDDQTAENLSKMTYPEAMYFLADAWPWKNRLAYFGQLELRNTTLATQNAELQAKIAELEKAAEDNPAKQSDAEKELAEIKSVFKKLAS